MLRRGAPLRAARPSVSPSPRVRVARPSCWPLVPVALCTKERTRQAKVGPKRRQRRGRCTSVNDARRRVFADGTQRSSRPLVRARSFLRRGHGCFGGRAIKDPSIPDPPRLSLVCLVSSPLLFSRLRRSRGRILFRARKKKWQRNRETEMGRYEKVAAKRNESIVWLWRGAARHGAYQRMTHSFPLATKRRARREKSAARLKCNRISTRRSFSLVIVVVIANGVFPPALTRSLDANVYADSDAITNDYSFARRLPGNG